MTASKLDPSTYNNAASNTVFDAVIDPNVLLAWRQNVKAVVDQHSTEIDGKLDKNGDTMTGDLNIGSTTNTAITNLRGKRLVNGVAMEYEIQISAPGGGAGEVVTFQRKAAGVVSGMIRIESGSRITLNGVKYLVGTGSPEGVITGNIGDIYTRTDGAATTTLYVKTSGTGNTGWTAK